MDFSSKLERALQTVAEDDNSRSMIKASLSNMLDGIGLLVAADAVEEMGDAAAQKLGGVIRQAVSGKFSERFIGTMEKLIGSITGEIEQISGADLFRRHHGYEFNVGGTRISLEVTPKRLWGSITWPDANGKRQTTESGKIEEILQWFPKQTCDQVLTLMLLTSLLDAGRASDGIDAGDYAAKRIGGYARRVEALANSIFMREEDERADAVEIHTTELSKTLDEMEEALDGQEPDTVRVVVDTLDAVLQRLTATYNETPAMATVFKLISSTLERMSRRR